MMSVVSQAFGASMRVVDALLGFPPPPAARGAPGLGTLPTAKHSEGIVVTLGIVILPRPLAVLTGW